MSALRWTRQDTFALAAVVLAVVAGALFYPIYYTLDPLEAMRARWRDDAGLLGRLTDFTGEPLWSDGAGGALPPGYPGNQGGKAASENMARLEAKLGGFSGRKTGQPAPDERWPALASAPTDAWGSPFWLNVSWAASTWSLTSAGPDRQIGTTDDLDLFLWPLMAYSMYFPLWIDLLLYLGAALFAWGCAVARAIALPRMATPWEVARAVVIVSPAFAVFGCLVGATGIRSISAWDELQIAPVWLTVSLTLSACCVGVIVWRRTRAVAEG